MNKSIRLLSVSLLFMTILLVSDSCKSKNYFVNASNGKTIDSRLVGVWEGSEEDAAKAEVMEITTTTTTIT